MCSEVKSLVATSRLWDQGMFPQFLGVDMHPIVDIYFISVCQDMSGFYWNKWSQWIPAIWKKGSKDALHWCPGMDYYPLGWLGHQDWRAHWSTIFVQFFEARVIKIMLKSCLHTTFLPSLALLFWSQLYW